VVLHFPLPASTEGVRIGEDWIVMGMRGSGSNTVALEDVFVPADSITLRRPMGKYHPVWSTILTVAWPLIGAAYMGVADASASIARGIAAKRGDDGITCILAGELENEWTTASLAFESMVRMANDLDFEPSVEDCSRILSRRTILTQAVVRTAEKAIEVAGGSGYFRQLGLERLLRDAYAGQFHPLPPKRQQRFTGRVAMGLSVDEAVE
jgi:alkylation response protein AidB-like acyl-CoA dehydrogenase